MAKVHYPIDAGENLPHEFNAIIEIPADGGSVKYELNKPSGLIMVDRFMPVSMHYPCNYGLVPCTHAEDDDPMDVLVMTPYPVHPGILLKVRAIGLMVMTDESGKDYKILAVPTEKSCMQYANIKSLKDIPQIQLDEITHFFEQYKALEPNKWVKLDGWQNAQEAERVLMESVERYNNQQ